MDDEMDEEVQESGEHHCSFEGTEHIHYESLFGPTDLKRAVTISDDIVWVDEWAQSLQTDVQLLPDGPHKDIITDMVNSVWSIVRAMHHIRKGVRMQLPGVGMQQVYSLFSVVQMIIGGCQGLAQESIKSATGSYSNPSISFSFDNLRPQ